MAGHLLAEWGQPCAACADEADAWAAQLANPPEELVLRSHDGKATYFRIPKHLRPRRKVRR